MIQKSILKHITIKTRQKFLSHNSQKNFSFTKKGLLQGNSQTITLSSLPQSSIVTSSGSHSILIQPDQASQSGTNLPLTPVTVDLPSIGAQSTNEESGVLLCNLDDLSKYVYILHLSSTILCVILETY